MLWNGDDVAVQANSTLWPRRSLVRPCVWPVSGNLCFTFPASVEKIVILIQGGTASTASRNSGKNGDLMSWRCIETSTNDPDSVIGYYLLNVFCYVLVFDFISNEYAH